MTHPYLARALLLAAAVAGAPSGAAEAPPPAPAEAGAPVPPLVFRSLLAGFRPFDDAGTTSWRQANDQAAAVGGWRTYARDLAPPASPGPAASAAAPLRKGAP